RGGVLARETRARDEAGIEAVRGDASESGRFEPARELVGEPEVAELAVHVGEPAVEVAVDARERSDVGDPRLGHPGPDLRIVHAGGDDDDAGAVVGGETT